MRKNFNELEKKCELENNIFLLLRCRLSYSILDAETTLFDVGYVIKNFERL